MMTPVPTDTAAPTMLSFLPEVPPEETKRLRFRTAREICETTSDEAEFVAAYVAFGAITELDGKPKAAGKTTFVLEMIAAVLDARPFLDRPTIGGPVVMLTEQPIASLKPALVRAGLTEREDFVLLTWAEAAGVPWPEVVEQAAATAREMGARLFVVDTLPQFAGLRGDAENNSGDALEAIGPLQLLAAAGFAILLTRHDRKSGGEVGDSARGSGAFTGAVDIVVGLGRDAHDARPTMRHLACLSRFTETPPELVIELVEGRYLVVGTSEEALAQARRERLLGALPVFEESTRLESLAEDLDEKTKTLRVQLNELLAEGLVARHGEGVRGKPFEWSLPRDRVGSTSSNSVPELAPTGAFFPFVSLRETHERKETAALPARPETPLPSPGFDDENMPVEIDYPPSAFADPDDDDTWRSDL